MAINVSSIQNAIYTILSSDSILVNSGFSVDLNQDLNTDPNRLPWIGVYGPRTVSDPFTVNITEPWMHSYEIMLMVQHGDAAAPRGAEEALALAVDQVWTTVNSNRKLNDTVDIVKRITVEPYQRDVEEQGTIATDVIMIEAEKRG